MDHDEDGGEGGIRTHGGREPTAVFETAALNHSATSPAGALPAGAGAGFLDQEAPATI